MRGFLLFREILHEQLFVDAEQEYGAWVRHLSLRSSALRNCAAVIMRDCRRARLLPHVSLIRTHRCLLNSIPRPDSHTEPGDNVIGIGYK